MTTKTKTPRESCHDLALEAIERASEAIRIARESEREFRAAEKAKRKS